jgi:dienelactone hydrolase
MPPPVQPQGGSASRGPWRRHRTVTAAVAAVAGVVVTAVGAGVAFRWLVKTGASGTSLAALLALVLGLAMLGFACRVFWRASHRWQRLWFASAAVVALAMMSSIAIGTMLAWAPRTALSGPTPADRGLSYTQVSFRTPDGVQLSAWWVPTTSGAAIVALPGSGSTRGATLDQATVLARHGYGVLLVDPRGQGESEGHAMDAGWWGDRDVIAAVAFAQRRPGVDPRRVGLLGLSMGGEEAIGAASAAHVRAVVAEGATARTAADKSGFLPGGVAGTVQRALDQLTYATADLLSPAPQPGPLYRSIVRARSTTFLLIAGGDVVDEPEAARYLQSAAPERVRTWVVPGAAHTAGLRRAPAEWTERVTSFLDRALDVDQAAANPD